MDIIFNCPHCEQELAVDSSGAGTQITCPSCEEEITIPEPASPLARTSGEASNARLEVHPVNPIASSAAAKIEKHLKVPIHDRPAASLIEKPRPPLEVTAKETDKKIRTRTIRHTDCIEVGHDNFDHVVTEFLNKVGESNIISISPINYTFLDIGTQKIMTEYGVFVVYRG